VCGVFGVLLRFFCNTVGEFGVYFEKTEVVRRGIENGKRCTAVFVAACAARGKNGLDKNDRATPWRGRSTEQAYGGNAAQRQKTGTCSFAWPGIFLLDAEKDAAAGISRMSARPQNLAAIR
jgi:hypothetical protein